MTTNNVNSQSLAAVAESSQTWLKIEQSIEDVTGLEKGEAGFECKLEGNPPPEAIWYKNGVPLTTDQRIKITSNHQWYRLEITELTLDDGGVYVLICKNSANELYTKACLFVVPLHDTVLHVKQIGMKCAVTGHVRNVQVQIGGMIELEAYFDEVAADYYWFKDREQVKSCRRAVILKSFKTSNLAIFHAVPTDTGVFYAIALTRNGIVTSIGHVQVMTSPNLVKEFTVPQFEEELPEEVETTAGEEIRLICRVSVHLHTDITWKRNNEPIDRTRCTPEEYGSRYIGLKFSYTSTLDTAEYTVELCHNYDTMATCSCNLKVVPAPPVYVVPVEVSKPLDNVVACYGAKIIIDCRFALEDPMYYYAVWYLGRYRVERSNSKFEVICKGGDFLLCIKQVEPTMTGNIACELRKVLPNRRSVPVNRTMGNLAIVPSHLLEDKGLVEDNDEYEEDEALELRNWEQVLPNKIGEDVAGPRGLQVTKFQTIAELVFCRMDEEGVSYVRVDKANTDVTVTGAFAYLKDDNGDTALDGPKTIVIDWKDTLGGACWYSVELQVDRCYLEAGTTSSPRFELQNPPVGKIIQFRVKTVDPVAGCSDAQLSFEIPPEMFIRPCKDVELKNMTQFGRLYFETGNTIGAGAFGNVVVVKNQQGKLYAAKIIKTRTQKRRESARREFEMMKVLQHPKLVDIRDAFVTRECFIIVMDFLWGGELFDRIVEEDYFREADVVPYVRQILEALDYLHSINIAHLDLKPENIVCMSPNTGQIKLIDFGLARKLDEGRLIRAIYGTKDYIAPEVLNYDGLTLVADMWSLGIVTYMLLSGLMPFPGDTWPERSANIVRVNYNYDDLAFEEISDLAKNFVDKLLVLSPNNRMTAKQALEHKWITEGPSQASKPGYYMKKTKENLKSYLANYRARWQRAGNVMIAAHRLRTLAVGLRTTAGVLAPTRIT